VTVLRDQVAQRDGTTIPAPVCSPARVQPQSFSTDLQRTFVTTALSIHRIRVVVAAEAVKKTQEQFWQLVQALLVYVFESLQVGD